MKTYTVYFSEPVTMKYKGDNVQQMGNEGQQEAAKGTGFQQRKQNNVHHQGQQQQHIPGKQAVGKGI